MQTPAILSSSAAQSQLTRSAPATNTSPSSEGLSPLSRSFRETLATVERSERVVDQAVRRVSRGADLSSEELLVVQAEVYRASQQAEMVSKVVDRVSDTVREITQIKI